jgi:hypothetical protein
LLQLPVEAMLNIKADPEPHKGADAVDPVTGEFLPTGPDRLAPRLALVAKANVKARRSLVRSYRLDVQRKARRALHQSETPKGNKWRTVECLRSVLPDSAGVAVCRSRETGAAAFRNLVTCGNLWTCPVCASKIAGGRRDEVRHAIQSHLDTGGVVLSVTLTLKHGASHSAGELLDGLTPALKRMRANRRVDTLRKAAGYLGGIKALEVTYGVANGWHPHVHELWFLGAGSVQVERWHQEVGAAWIAAVRSSGLPEPSMRHGCLVKVVTEAREYEGKGVGQIDGIDGTWDAADEITRSVAKGGRDDRFSPFDLLVEGRPDLFEEYARAFHGKRQLTWSRGLKAHFKVNDRSDEDLASDESQNGEPVLMIPREGWKRLVWSDVDLRVSVLEMVEGPGGASAALAFLGRFGISAELLDPGGG